MAKLTPRAKKSLDRLPPPVASKAVEIIGRLDREPSLGKKLRGRLEGKRVVNLGRSRRIIYSGDSGEIIVLSISHRQDAYK